jgi:hypothetical protein
MRRDFLRGIVRDVRSGKGFLARDLGKTHRLVMENGLIKICAKPSLPKAERFEQHRAGLQRDAQSAIWHTKAWKVQQIGKDKET